jgi:tetratricopeptide (TPR) repeat protein
MATYILLKKRGEYLEKAGLIDDAKEAYLGLVDYAKGTSKPIFVIFSNDALRRLAELETDIAKKERYYRHMLKIVMANESRKLPDYDLVSAGVKTFILKRSEELLTDNILLYGNFLLEQKMYEEVLFLVQEGLVIAKKNDRRLPRVSSMYDMAGWACWNLGKVDEALEWGKKALVHANRFFNLNEDQFLYHMGLYSEV